jgi:hypothetical protein
MDVLDRSPETRVYQEYDRAAFRRWRLRPAAERAALLRQARCRRVVYKPLQDSQHVDRLLAEHPDARVVWVLRRYPAVARSWTAKWGEALRAPLRRLATEPDCDHWLAERMPEARHARVRELYREDLPVPTGAALRWFLRNEIFFDRQLQRAPERVHALWYEDLLRDPQASADALFGFLGLPAPGPQSLREVHRAPGADSDEPPIETAVRELCEDLMRRLESAVPPRGEGRR